MRVRASLDPFTKVAPNLELTVTAKTDDQLEIGLGAPGPQSLFLPLDVGIPTNSGGKSWGEMFLAVFKPGAKYALICPVRSQGAGPTAELRLVTERIRNHIATSHGSLNAPPGNTTGHETAVCVAAGGPGSPMVPRNLPTLSKKPRNLSEIIGIYDGGGGHDCGVFRPAGRCKMRNNNDETVPFCHICRYLIVDRLDPTKHGELDALYPEVAP
jgi:hypothetical protein